MNAWTVVLLAGLCSYVLRMSMIASSRWRPPASLDAAAGFVGPSAFAALGISAIAASVVSAGSMSAFAPLTATVVAILAVARTGSPHAAALAGMPTVWILNAVLPT